MKKLVIGKMMNLIVVHNKKEEINSILSKNIKGIILGVESLSIYNLSLPLDEIVNISNNTNKEIIIAINKMLHNEDLSLVEEVLERVKKTNIKKILFYDLAVLNIAKRLNVQKELIYSSEHLNASIDSNNFYFNHGVKNVLITSDITYKEILDIKAKTKMSIYYTVYGHLPIFYSRRYLISNYFSYINKKKEDTMYYIKNEELNYLIKEADYGTVIYSPCINLLNFISKIKNIDYYVIDLSFVEDISIIDNFISGEEMEENLYTGFFDKETTYKLKEERKG